MEHDRLAGPRRLVHGQRIADPHRHLSPQRWHDGGRFQLFGHQAGKHADGRRLFGLLVQLAGQRFWRMEQHLHQQRHADPDGHLSPKRWNDGVRQQLQCGNETRNQRDLGRLLGLFL